MSTLTDNEIKIPKYLQLLEHFQQQIATGVLQPGDRLPSFHKLREQRGFTNSTVEKVYGILERDGLIVRQSGSGTFVAQRRNRAQAKVLKQRSGIIGVSGMGFSFAGSSSYWARMLQGMREAVQQEKSQLMLLDHNSFEGWEKADGVLLSDYVSEKVLEHLPPGMPRAYLVTPLPGMVGVTTDDYSGGRLATEHLLELGHRKIAYLQYEDNAVHARRAAGYRDALKAAGITPQADWVRSPLKPYMYFDHHNYGDDFVRAGREGMKAWLEDGWSTLGCTAIQAHNDETAVGIIEAFREANLSVPGDVSVVGFDGVEISAHSNPSLTTIEVPLRQIGVIGAEILMNKINNGHSLDEQELEHRVLPVQLKVRESTAPPAHVSLSIHGL